MDAASYCDICKHGRNSKMCSECTYNTLTELPPTKFEQMEKESKVSDPVNHPAHYETGKFECIEVMKEVFGIEAVQNFCLLNAFKYIYRCNHKNNKTEDIKKANWYINKHLELESEKHGKS